MSFVICNVIEPARPRIRHLGDERTGKTLCGVDLSQTRKIIRPERIPEFVLCSKCDRAISAAGKKE